MADAKTPAPDDNLYLQPRDMLGIIQRSLWELSHYISQPAVYVDPRVIAQELHATYEWVRRLPMPPADAKQGAQAEARAN